MAAAQKATQLVGQALQKAGDQQLAGMADRVMPKGPPGPWDNSIWSPIGTLIVAKGENGLMINVSASSAGKTGAFDLATKAVPRLSQPLEYDGAKAATLAPKPHLALANPCDLIPRAKVEQALGGLSGAPQKDPAGGTCTYSIATSDGPEVYPMSIQWTDGYRAYARVAHSPATVSEAMGGGLPMGGNMPALPPDAQKMLGKFMGATVGVSPHSSVVTHGMAHDTTLTGPWDAGGVLLGTTMAVTCHDVMVAIALQKADYDKSKALLGAACRSL